MRKSIDTIDTIAICIILDVSILKLIYSIVLSIFFQLVKYSLEGKKHWKTPMKSLFYIQSQQKICRFTKYHIF